MAHMNDRFIFYHIPKTGGKWVLASMHRGGVRGIMRAPKLRIRPLGLWGQHSTFAAMADEHKRARFQFCFVRRPFEWYRSFWAFRKKEAAASPPPRKQWRATFRFVVDGLMDDRFQTFLENVLCVYPDGLLTEIYQKYVGPDASWMDFVGRQENLQQDLIRAMDLAGEDVPREWSLRRLKPMNVSAGAPEWGDQAVCRPEMRGKIEAAEHWILETFYDAA
jgi:hypothetical protein